MASSSWVPETIARPSAISSRIRTSTFRSERRRQIANAAIRAAITSPAARMRGQLGREQAGKWEVDGQQGREEDRCATPCGLRFALQGAIPGFALIGPLPSRDHANPDPRG